MPHLMWFHLHHWLSMCWHQHMNINDGDEANKVGFHTLKTWKCTPFNFACHCVVVFLSLTSLSFCEEGYCLIISAGLLYAFDSPILALESVEYKWDDNDHSIALIIFILSRRMNYHILILFIIKFILLIWLYLYSLFIY